MLSDITIRPIKGDVELLKKIYEEANKDGGRNPLCPTHVVIKKGEIIGAFCTQSPTVFYWLHTQKSTKRDTLLVYQSIDTLMNQQGTPEYIYPCEPESPYFKLLESRFNDIHHGTDGGSWTLFLKRQT